MRSSVDIWIDAERDPSALFQALRHCINTQQLRRRLNVEVCNARIQRSLDFAFALTDTGEHYLLRVTARCQHTRQLPARDDVESCAAPRQHVEHRQIRV